MELHWRLRGSNPLGSRLRPVVQTPEATSGRPNSAEASHQRTTPIDVFSVSLLLRPRHSWTIECSTAATTATHATRAAVTAHWTSSNLPGLRRGSSDRDSGCHYSSRDRRTKDHGRGALHRKPQLGYWLYLCRRLAGREKPGKRYSDTSQRLGQLPDCERDDQL